MNQRELRTPRSRAAIAPALPDRIVQLIVKAPYAHLVARPETDRTVVLPEIVSLHTRQELLGIERLGPATVRKLESWLTHYQKRLRKPDESLDAVICHFDFRIDRVRRPNGRHARHNAGVNARMDPASASGRAPSPRPIAATDQTYYRSFADLARDESCPIVPE